MTQPPKSRRVGPPHNPAVRELVEGKRHWSSPVKISEAKRGFRNWNERGYLPHRDQPGLTQFVTFHLADSFPVSLRSEWEHLSKIEEDLERRAQFEAYLDKGRGDCHLRRHNIARLIENNLLKFSGERYQLRAWVLMPNHLHVLFEVGTVSMSETVGAWKKHTARLAHRLLRKRGAFWANDYFDTYMRNADHERRTIRYIENNPVKAKLISESREWPWSSARFRDKNGRLQISGTHPNSED